jgi:hypothetical protein
MTLTEDERGARGGDGRQVSERGPEAERPRLRERRRRERASVRGVVGAEGRGEEREVKDHDEQRRRADEKERREHRGEEEGRLGPPPRPRPHRLAAAPTVRVLVRQRQQLLLHCRRWATSPASPPRSSR